MASPSHRRDCLWCPPDEIHLWRLDVSNYGHDADRHWQVLDAAEQERAQRIRTTANQRRYVAAQCVLRCLLARYLETEPTAVRFQRNPFGKPFLADSAFDRGLVFNISHSGDYVFFAIGRDLALGVDVEVHRSIRNIEGLVEHCFASSERAYWNTLSESERIRVFFDFWTAKEAFVKAVGRGLGLGLSRCVLTCDADSLTSVPDGCGHPDHWSFWRLNDQERGVSGALCAHTGHGEFRLRQLDVGSF